MLNLKYYRAACLKLVFLCLLEYSATLFYFLTQGLLISYIIQQKQTNPGLLNLIMLFITSKICMLFFKLLRENLNDFFVNHELSHQALIHFPRQLVEQQKNDGGQYFNLIHTVFDGFIRNKFNLFSNRFIFSLMMVIYLSFLVYSHFPTVGLFFPALFFSVFINQFFWANKIEEKCQCYEHQKKDLLTWHEQYFQGFREIASAWRSSVLPNQWSKLMLEKFHQSKKSLATFFWRFNLITQGLIELPFIAIHVFLLLEVYWQALPLGIAFVWLGIAQFMLQAAQMLAKNTEIKKQLSIQKKMLLDGFKYPLSIQNNTPHPSKLSANMPNFFKFTLRNKKKVSLHLTPGIQIIFAENGAGKTTLFNALLSYNFNTSFEKTPALQHFRQMASIKRDEIRIIDRDIILFNSLKNFSQQITGPEFDLAFSETLEIISLNLKLFKAKHPTLNKSTIQLIDYLRQLEKRYNKRKDKTLSLGEGIFLSLARNLFTWHKGIKVLLIDECDASLDRQKRVLFLQIVKIFSNKTRIYFVSHHLRKH